MNLYHFLLGNALRAQGKLDEAVAAYRESLQLLPVWQPVLTNLLDVLKTQGKFDEVTAELRATVELCRKHYGPAVPRTADALAQLGRDLVDRSQWSEAEPVLRECLAIREKTQPDVWTTFNTRSVLGACLFRQKKFAEAESPIVSGYEGLKARVGKDPAGSEKRLAEASERIVPLYEAWGKKDRADEWRARLATRTPAEKLGFAAEYIDRKQFAAAARSYAEALAAEPKLADSRQDQHRYNAACCAALAASGQTRDDQPPDATARARFRGQALEWLRAELVDWSRVLSRRRPECSSPSPQRGPALEGRRRPGRHPRSRATLEASGGRTESLADALGGCGRPPEAGPGPDPKDPLERFTRVTSIRHEACSDFDEPEAQASE